MADIKQLAQQVLDASAAKQAAPSIAMPQEQVFQQEVPMEPAAVDVTGLAGLAQPVSAVQPIAVENLVPQFNPNEVAAINATKGAPKNADEWMKEAAAREQDRLKNTALGDKASTAASKIDSVAQEIADSIPVEDAAQIPEVQQAAQEIADKSTEKIKQAAAQTVAAEKAQDIELGYQDAIAKKQAEVNKAVADIDARVRLNTLPQILNNGSWGAKIGAVMAVMLGGVGSGLTGKSNAALDYFDKIADQQAAADKLSAEEKMALQKGLYEYGDQYLKAMQNKTDNYYRKQEIDMKRQEIQARQAQISSEMQAKAAELQQKAGIYSGNPLSPEQIASLSVEQQGGLVNLPSGVTVMARNPKLAAPLGEKIASSMNAIDGIDYLLKMAKKPGAVFSPAERAKMDLARTSLIGQLRLPFFGPGPMIEPEYNRLSDVVGDTTKFSNFLTGRETHLLDKLKEVTKMRLLNEARTAGIKAPVWKDTYKMFEGKLWTKEKLAQEFKRRYPKIPDDVINGVYVEKVRDF